MVNATAKLRSSKTPVFQVDTHNSTCLKEQVRSNLLERDYGLQVHHRKTARDQHDSTVGQVNVILEHNYFSLVEIPINNTAKKVSKTSPEI